MGIPAIHMTEGVESQPPREIFQRSNPTEVAEFLLERARLGGYEGTDDEVDLLVVLSYAVIARRNELAAVPREVEPSPGFRKTIIGIITGKISVGSW